MSRLQDDCFGAASLAENWTCTRSRAKSFALDRVRALLLDGGSDDDADTGTDTTAPDDDKEDTASFTSQQILALQFSNM